jgi:hypothetical protein
LLWSVHLVDNLLQVAHLILRKTSPTLRDDLHRVGDAGDVLVGGR